MAFLSYPVEEIYPARELTEIKNNNNICCINNNICCTNKIFAVYIFVVQLLPKAVPLSPIDHFFEKANQTWM